MRVTVEFDRIDEVHDRANDEFRKGIIDMAVRVQASAQSRAAVDTGYMRDHIFTYPERYPDVQVVSEANYSLFVERGTRHSRGGTRWTIPAQPFMRPAYEEYGPTRAEQYLGNRLRGAIT